MFTTTAAEKDIFTAGGDFRIRQEALDNIPTRSGNYARGGTADYFRFRTRLWLKAEPVELLTFNVRMVHEFYHYLKPSSSHTRRWPEEAVFDALNVTVNLPDGKSKIVIGRQDIKEDAHRRVLGGGTTKDAGRTDYMDGVSTRLHFNDSKTLVSLFGVYDNALDPLAIGNVNRDLNGYESHDTGMDEAGAGIAIRQELTKGFLAEIYYIWKHDTAWMSREQVHMPNEDIHTFGAQLFAEPREGLKLEAEAAGQWSPTSDSDRRAMMAGASARQYFACDSKPYVGIQALYLSGDDPETDRREDWNPLWARGPWLGEMLQATYDGDLAAMQNIFYTYLEGGFRPREQHLVTGTLGYVYAPEANGPGDGHSRGYYATTRYDFPLWKCAENNLRLFGHVTAQVFQPDNYYEKDDRLAYFLRWELTFAF